MNVALGVVDEVGDVHVPVETKKTENEKQTEKNDKKTCFKRKKKVDTKCTKRVLIVQVSHDILLPPYTPLETRASSHWFRGSKRGG